MSEIYEQPEIEILSGKITYSPKQIQGQCEYCPMYTYNGFSLLGKVVCENCREKLLKRVNLIMQLE